MCTSSRRKKKEEEIFIFELPFSFFRTDSLCSIESETTHLTTRLSLSLRLIPGPPPPPSIKQNACWQNPLREDLYIFFYFCSVRKRHLLLPPPPPETYLPKGGRNGRGLSRILRRGGNGQIPYNKNNGYIYILRGRHAAGDGMGERKGMGGGWTTNAFDSWRTR